MLALIRGVVIRVSIVLPVVTMLFFMVLFEIDRFVIPNTELEIGFFSLLGLISAQQPFSLWVFRTYGRMAKKAAADAQQA